MLALGLAVVVVGSWLIAARLWRAGRVSDRAASLVLVGLVPLTSLLYAVLTGADILVLVIVALAFVPAAALYPTLLGWMEEEGDQMRRDRGQSA